MRSIKYVGVLAAVATMVMSVGASAAFAAPEFKSNKTFPVSFSGTGGAGELTTANETVKCTSSSSAGSVEKTKVDKVKITYNHCQGSFGGFPIGECQNQGAGTEKIVTNALVGLPDDVSSYTSGIGIEFKAESGTELASFTCGGVTQKVTGKLICESSPPNKLSLSAIVDCDVSAPGKQIPAVPHLEDNGKEAAQETEETIKYESGAEVEQKS